MGSSPSRYMERLNLFGLLQEVCLSFVIVEYLTLTVFVGTGAFKIGANYAPGLMPQREAAKKGYDQNLWLHGPEHYLTEVSRSFTLTEVFMLIDAQVGAMNMFVCVRKGDGM